jgi:lipopolysaccharide assembly outer membrane protein LptD (OstA)
VFIFVEGKNKLKSQVKVPIVHAILVIIFLFSNFLTNAQTKSISNNDSILINKKTDSLQLPISDDKLESVVNYHAKDSIVFDAKRKLLFLHKEAEISFEEIKVKADFIEYEQDSNRLTALKIDSVHTLNDTSFKSSIAQGEESSTFTSLFYNFKSKRALVENAYSQYGEGFVLSNQVKRNNDNSINGYRNIYTTCNDPHPHFGIAAKKIKIIPNKVAVSGSANLVIEDIPTPLYLPFGLFPLTKGQHSGFILPTYDMSQNLGFGLLGGGYYFALNKHWDAKLMTNIYAKGTWLMSGLLNYNYRYRFNGNFNISYGLNKYGDVYEANSSNERSYSITWRHNVNQNVMPGANFSADVNLNSRRFQKLNSQDLNAILQNSISSGIAYSKSWQGKPFNFSIALRHTQNTGNGFVQLTLPEMNFGVNQIFPFQFRKEIIKPTWYEKIGASYQVSFTNQLSFYDSIYSLKKMRFEDFQNGIRHTIPISANYTLLKYMNTSFSINYNEYWYSNRSFKQFNFQKEKLDTLKDIGFFSARYFDFNTSFSTRIYGIKLMKKGIIRGIRHVMTPSVTLGFHPDFGRGNYNYYYNTFLSNSFNTSRVSYYEGAILGSPPDGKYGGIQFNLGNTLGLKVRSKKDTSNGGFRKINLIDGLNFATSYNMAVDSFKWSNLSIGYRTTLVESVILSGGMSYSPYAINKVNGSRKATYLKDDGGKLLKFQSAGLALSASLPFKKKNQTPVRTEEQKRVIGNAANYADFNVPWTLSLNYSIDFNKSFLVRSQKDTLTSTQSLRFNGDVNLTSKWKVGFNSGFDFKSKQINSTSIDVYRDLHCWEMRLNLILFNFRQTYNFGLNVKSAVLQDLKLNRRKDFRDFL